MSRPPRCPSATRVGPWAVRWRETPEDFRVDECLDIPLTGSGEHLWLRVRKRERDTPEVARLLARSLGVPERDVGYAGLKDRHAITTQWFSVRGVATGEAALASAGVEVLESRRHVRKLKRGAHHGNRFTLVLRGLDTRLQAELETTLETVKTDGFPNYFGPQRFGAGHRNLALGLELVSAAAAGRRVPRTSRIRRSLSLSAVRAALFNAVCAARVASGSWRAPLAGEPILLGCSRSFFLAERRDTSLPARLATGEVSTSGPLVGGPGSLASDACERYEADVLSDWRDAGEGLVAAGLSAARRALVARARALEVERIGNDGLRLAVTLDRGVFATSLLAEIGVQGAGFR